MADPYLRIERQAVAAARAVVAPAAPAPGVADVSFTVLPDAAAIESLLGAAAGSERDVAASAAIDPATGVPRVFINKAAMSTLNDQGVRIVLTHEATHVLTGVVGNTAMPLWLVEGFADYVALLGVHKPLSVEAGRILAEVKDGQLPDRLPLQPDFDAARAAGADAYTAVYEASWLACRWLAQSSGQGALVRLYVDVRDGTPVDQAMRDDIGMTLATFTSQWQRNLRLLATRP